MSVINVKILTNSNKPAIRIFEIQRSNNILSRSMSFRDAGDATAQRALMAANLLTVLAPFSPALGYVRGDEDQIEITLSNPSDWSATVDAAKTKTREKRIAEVIELRLKNGTDLIDSPSPSASFKSAAHYKTTAGLKEIDDLLKANLPKAFAEDGGTAHVVSMEIPSGAERGIPLIFLDGAKCKTCSASHGDEREIRRFLLAQYPNAISGVIFTKAAPG